MTGLPVYVIYKNPSDYPGQVVLRQQTVEGNDILVDAFPIAVIDMIEWGVPGAIEQARRYVPDGKVRIERSPEDEPHIVESWL